VQATQLSALSEVRRDLGDADSAMALVAQAVGVLWVAGDTTGEHYLRALSGLAYALRGAQRLDSAEVVYLQVIDRHKRLVPQQVYDLGTAHNNLGYLYRVKGDFPAAERAYREAVRLTGEAVGVGHPETQMYRSNLAAVLELRGGFDEVVLIGREQVAAARQAWPEGHWRVGSAHMALGRFLVRRGRGTDALPSLQAGVRSYTATIGADHTWTLVALAYQGTAQLLAGQTSAGEATFDRAYALLLRRRGNLDSDSRSALTQLAEALESAENADLAARLRRLLPAGYGEDSTRRRRSAWRRLVPRGQHDPGQVVRQIVDRVGGGARALPLIRQDRHDQAIVRVDRQP
jgi:serine/threonine-protein kinase